MAFIEWQDQLATDIFVIDSEHKLLISYLNDLHAIINDETLDQPVRDKGTLDVLNHLTEYTQTHFVVEEELMRVYEYPGMVNHKSEHDSFVAKVGYLTSEIQADPMNISNLLLNYLKDWLTKHILGTDAKLGKFLVEKGQN